MVIVSEELLGKKVKVFRKQNNRVFKYEGELLGITDVMIFIKDKVEGAKGIPQNEIEDIKEVKNG